MAVMKYTGKGRSGTTKGSTSRLEANDLDSSIYFQNTCKHPVKWISDNGKCWKCGLLFAL